MLNLQVFMQQTIQIMWSELSMHQLCEYPSTQRVLATHTTDTSDHVVEDLLNEQDEEEYVDDSDEHLEEVREDEELNEIMDFVFGPESDEDITDRFKTIGRIKSWPA